MSARRCSLCGINYPTDYGKFTNCPVHSEPTQFISNAEPDEDWLAQVARLQEHLEPREPTTLEDLIPAVEGKVTVRGSELFVYAWDVFAASGRRLDPGDLIRVGKQTFEILEYIHEPREYWVKPFAVTVEDEDETLAEWLGA